MTTPGSIENLSHSEDLMFGFSQRSIQLSGKTDLAILIQGPSSPGTLFLAL